MTEEIISKETLQEKLDAIKQVITKRQWKYYHIEAIDNFIYHLNNLPSERTQQRVASYIHDYLTLLSERMNKEHELFALSRELTPHMWKISDTYRWELNFVGKPYYPFQIAFWTILFFILRLTFSTIIALLSVAVIAISTIIYYQLKIKAKEYY